jgi:dolichol-phosphate mannosyltransferase
MNSKVLVVIPAYNEEKTILEVASRSLKYADVSVTDDGSRDNTPGILKELKNKCEKGFYPHKLNIITHEKSTHIPKGIQDGLKFAVDSGKYEFVITMDAGLSHDPDQLPDFINFDPSADVVIGSRRKIDNVPFYRRVVSRLGALVVNYSLSDSYWNLFGPGIKDCTSGFRRYSRRAAELIAEAELKSRSFDFHMEALALCVRSGMKISEIPINYIFSNSSFNRKVLKQAIKFGLYLIKTKK